jgi:SAM-dependent methyltransferase
MIGLQHAALPIITTWKDYFLVDRDEGLGSSYERIMLNRKLSELSERYIFKTALEAPSFGFTGLSGINSLWLTKQHGVEVTVADTDRERLELIQGVWDEVELQMNPVYLENYLKLPFADQAYDFSWNFASLWFTDDPDGLLKELTRVTRRVILISVPNQNGLGYQFRKYLSKGEFEKLLKESAIEPKHIITQMKSLKWKLGEWDYIDVPPFPDIAMKKEDFLKLIRMKWLLRFFKKKEGKPVFYSIMDYYTGKNPNFEQEMLKYAWVERYAPRVIKYFWAHHKYFVFEPV